VEFKHRTLEKLVKMDFAVLDGARILVTGHTGFKGFWLSRLLQKFGTEVHGISLAPELGSLFDRAECEDFASSHFLDITRQQDLLKLMKGINPDAVIHMAAQPLVRRSYREPLFTFNTNVIGTANVLESIRNLERTRGAVVVTSDKVYKNLETGQAYKENSELGGKDPYSASKSASEMVVSAWRHLINLESNKSIVSARAGNIIGGGDHSEDRLVPDLIRAFRSNSPVVIRHPDAVRPWQHVLDPLMGYLKLISRILGHHEVGESYNFGPNEDLRLTVEELVELVCKEWGHTAGWIQQKDRDVLPEAKLLWLNSHKAKSELDWTPKLKVNEAITWTIKWERESANSDVQTTIDNQIAEYMELNT
jgi:CDP-glucose 4,6-dehydratase